MGIKNLLPFLRKNCPNSMHNTNLSNYAFKKIAVDFSVYLYKLKALLGDSGWRDGWFRLLLLLRRNKIHCVIIYDNPVSSIDKSTERIKRADRKKKQIARVEEIESSLEKYHSTGIIDDVLSAVNSEGELNTRYRLLKEGMIDTQKIEDKIAKLRSHIMSVSECDFQQSKEVCDVLNVPYIESTGEAEALCAMLNVQGKVDAVLTEDSDAYAYGTNVVLSKLNISTGTCVETRMCDILNSLHLTQDMFRDMCILFGTDYNNNIVRVGSVKAYSLINQYESIDNIRGYDISILKHNTVRNIFKTFCGCDGRDYNVSYCFIPDFAEIERFLFKTNSRVGMEYILECFDSGIVFEE